MLVKRDAPVGPTSQDRLTDFDLGRVTERKDGAGVFTVNF
jgi:hypothetical protein